MGEMGFEKKRKEKRKFQIRKNEVFWREGLFCMIYILHKLEELKNCIGQEF